MSSALVKQPQRQPAERVLSWGEVDWMIEVAVSKMRGRRFHPERIVPIGGGGIIPAAIMAYRYYKKDKLPVELFPPVYAKSYGPDHQQHELSILWPEGLKGFDAPATLFVDDIVDTGATLAAIKQTMPRSSVFSLVTKIDGQPNWYATYDREDQWWYFPWEKEPPAQYLDKK